MTKHVRSNSRDVNQHVRTRVFVCFINRFMSSCSCRTVIIIYKDRNVAYHVASFATSIRLYKVNLFTSSKASRGNGGCTSSARIPKGNTVVPSLSGSKTVTRQSKIKRARVTGHERVTYE